MELAFEQDKEERGGWRQLGRRGANGASCTHSANKSCLFAQAVGGRFWPINTDPRGPELPQFPLRKTLPKSRQRETKKERENSIKAWPCELVVDSDQEFACVKWRSTENGNKRQGEGFREGLEHSRAHAQGEWD